MNEQLIKLVETVISQGGDAALKVILVIQLVSITKVIAITFGVPFMIFRGAREIVRAVKE